MAYMKMLGLVVIASATGVSRAGEKRPAKVTLNTKSAGPATAREAKCPS